MCCAGMHLYQAHSSPLEAAEAGTQTVGHSPQGLQAFPGFPADAALGLAMQLSNPAALWTQRWPAGLQVLPRRIIGETHRYSQQKSLSETREFSPDIAIPHPHASQVSGHDLAVSPTRAHEQGLRSRAARASRKHFLAPQACAQLLPAGPVLAAGTQCSGAHKKFCVEPTAHFSSRTSRPFVPQWN